MSLIFYIALALTVFLLVALLLAPVLLQAVAGRQTNAGDGAEHSPGRTKRGRQRAAAKDDPFHGQGHCKHAWG